MCHVRIEIECQTGGILLIILFFFSVNKKKNIQDLIFHSKFIQSNIKTRVS